MSDTFETRLHRASKDYPRPDEDTTRRVREHVVGAAHPDARRRRRLTRFTSRTTARLALAAFLGVVFAAGAFAAGYSLRGGPTNPSGTPGAGPGFLPAIGWNLAQSGLTAPPGAMTSVAANVPFSPSDHLLAAPPSATIRSLGPSGILFSASFGAATRGDYPERTLPLQLSDAVPGSMEGFPQPGETLRLQAHSNGYDIDVLIVFGAEHPPAAVKALAAQELARLVTPGCPKNAATVGPDDLTSARSFILGWVRAAYLGDPSDLSGMQARAMLLSDGDASLRQPAVQECGRGIEGSSIEVDVVFPPKAVRNTIQPSRKYLLYRQYGVWTVWLPG